MKKSLEKKIQKYVDESEFPFAVYFTKNPINFNDDQDWGYKYFFVFCSTHKVVNRFSSQRELEEFLDGAL